MVRSMLLWGACCSALLIQPVTAQGVSQKVSNEMTAERFGPVEIVIDDQAVNGCWTNVREVKTMSETYLTSEAGLTVTSMAPGKFIISVIASRHKGRCSGRIALRLFNAELGDQAEYGMRSAECSQAARCDPMVKYQVSMFAQALRLAAEGWVVTE